MKNREPGRLATVSPFRASRFFRGLVIAAAMALVSVTSQTSRAATGSEHPMAGVSSGWDYYCAWDRAVKVKGHPMWKPAKGVVRVEVSEDRTYLIKDDGNLIYTGYGEVFMGTQHYEMRWRTVAHGFTPNIHGMTMVAPENTQSFNSACGLSTSGEVLCWGSGERGKLGNKHFEQQAVPNPPAW